MNLFRIKEIPDKEEIVEELIPDRGIKIERIISRGHHSPDNFWYNQERDEWVALLQGKATISWPDGKEVKMSTGDWLLIRAGEKHRVKETSVNPPCIWLALHGKMC